MSQKKDAGYYRKMLDGHLKNICIPRLVDSAGHEKVNIYIKKKLSEYGIVFDTQPFLVNPREPQILSMISLLNVIMLVAAYYFTMVTFVPAAVFAILSINMLGQMWILADMDMSSKMALTKKGMPCENIIAKLRPEKEPVNRIVVSGHYDSKSQSFNILWRSLMFGLAYMFIFIFWCISLYYLLWNYLPQLPDPTFRGSLFALAALVLFILQTIQWTHNLSPGAYDNGVSVAAMLGLAERLADKPLESTEVTFLFSDAEEMGLLGALVYSQSDYMEDMDVNINVDMPVSKEGVIYINKGFVIPWAMCSPNVNRVLLEEGKKLGLQIKHTVIPTGAGADHIVFHHKRREVVSLTGPFYQAHSEHDTIEALPKDAALNVLDLLENGLRAIDEKAEPVCTRK